LIAFELWHNATFQTSSYTDSRQRHSYNQYTKKSDVADKMGRGGMEPVELGVGRYADIFLSASGMPTDMGQQPTGLRRIQHIERRWRWGIPAKVLVERSGHAYIIAFVLT
jgi:hypothetical protein